MRAADHAKRHLYVMQHAGCAACKIEQVLVSLTMTANSWPLSRWQVCQSKALYQCQASYIVTVAAKPEQHGQSMQCEWKQREVEWVLRMYACTRVELVLANGGHWHSMHGTYRSIWKKRLRSSVCHALIKCRCYALLNATGNELFSAGLLLSIIVHDCGSESSLFDLKAQIRALLSWAVVQCVLNGSGQAEASTVLILLLICRSFHCLLSIPYFTHTTDFFATCFVLSFSKHETHSVCSCCLTWMNCR